MRLWPAPPAVRQEPGLCPLFAEGGELTALLFRLLTNEITARGGWAAAAGELPHVCETCRTSPV